MNSEARTILPQPDRTAFFPKKPSDESQEWKRTWAINKAGEDNLIYAIGYGSQVTGDATPTSIYDFILVVKDKKAFHKKVLKTNKEDYGSPKNATWHALINRGPSYYHTEEDGHKAKYIVIDEAHFIKGCNGSLPRKDRKDPGGHGMSIAGRVQKVALDPIYETKDELSKSKIQRAINKARIDGVWLALGTVGNTFKKEDLISEYVSLSYRFDVRIEKPGKAKKIITQASGDYDEMIKPILEKFSDAGIIRQQSAETVVYEKLESPSASEIKKRKWSHKIRSAGRNYIKNAATVGLLDGAKYALAKVKRAKN